MRPVRIAIFASGTGSNALELIKKSQQLGAEKIQISFVLSDKAQAPVLQKAQSENVPTHLLEKKQDRKTHETAILNLLREYQVDWIFLAGYMRLLSAFFISEFSRWHGDQAQIVNIHPSLLPAYPGVDSIARAYHDKVNTSGVSLHLVDEGMDTGKILQQKSLPLSPSESLEAWASKIHTLEHQIYCELLESVAQGHIRTHYFQEPV